ncbi:MAG: hypothetical protein Q8K33_22195 [Cypionkella sp.]|uniref:hypothetical protein n=1 Tax=Cypionkella sp. TaxID=2811411 RepID=UPI002730D8A0|nr:hypothetical protein [Cypionkella sp.]MDP2051538.1 hypothetical protein [Cypionkella sp.]
MTAHPPISGAVIGLSKADIESVNSALWRVIDLCAAGNVILDRALAEIEDTPAGKGLSGILGAIELLADGANLKLMKVL